MDGFRRFLKRHTNVFGTMCGERADVDNTVVDDWMKKLPGNNQEKKDPSEIERTYNIRKRQTLFY